MAPKIKIAKEDILRTAIALVRENGASALNARAIAAALHCSTQPIFSNFSSMEALQEATVAAAYGVYLDFLKSEAESGKYPPYKAYGMAYIRFAKEEMELFRLLFMRERTETGTTSAPDFEASVQMIMQANGITKEKATLIHLEVWCCVHGIATMLVTSFLPLEWDLISDMLTDVYLGIREKHLKEEN